MGEGGTRKKVLNAFHKTKKKKHNDGFAGKRARCKNGKMSAENSLILGKSWYKRTDVKAKPK